MANPAEQLEQAAFLRMEDPQRDLSLTFHLQNL